MGTETLAAVALIFCILVAADKWVSVEASKTILKLKKTSNGDQVMDFSSVGYKGMAASFPYPEVKMTLHPSGGDDSIQLQNAIDKVSAMKLDSQGLRGTIKLADGTFNVGNKTLVIMASGVVIDGSGTETVLNAHNLTANILFKIMGDGDPQGHGPKPKIVKTAPSGTALVTLNDTSMLKVGDYILISWPWSMAWIKMMNMTEYWSYRAGTVELIERRVKSIFRNSSTILLDIPIPFRIDVKYLDNDSNYSAYVQKMEYPVKGRISNIGLQNFRAVKDATLPNGTGCFLSMKKVENSWLNNLAISDFSGTIQVRDRRVVAPELMHSTMFISGKQITVQGLTLKKSLTGPRGPKAFDIALQAPGQQILVRDIITSGDKQYSLITNSGITGPNVFYNCTSYGKSSVQPHEWFATGLLYDNVRVPNGTIEFINRKAFGHGQGIAIGYGVVWNSLASGLDVLSPPGGANWVFGTKVTGKINTQIGSAKSGIFDNVTAINIPSLYLAQYQAAHSHA